METEPAQVCLHTRVLRGLRLLMDSRNQRAVVSHHVDLSFKKKKRLGNISIMWKHTRWLRSPRINLSPAESV